MARKTRTRSARSGEFVSEAEAAAKPAETVRERDSGLAKRVARLERTVREFGGPLAKIFERLN